MAALLFAVLSCLAVFSSASQAFLATDLGIVHVGDFPFVSYYAWTIYSIKLFSRSNMHNYNYVFCWPQIEQYTIINIVFSLQFDDYAGHVTSQDENAQTMTQVSIELLSYRLECVITIIPLNVQDILDKSTKSGIGWKEWIATLYSLFIYIIFISLKHKEQKTTILSPHGPSF